MSIIPISTERDGLKEEVRGGCRPLKDNIRLAGLEKNDQAAGTARDAAVASQDEAQR